jgi:hypothetical protein
MKIKINSQQVHRIIAKELRSMITDFEDDGFLNEEETETYMAMVIVHNFYSMQENHIKI